MKISLVQQNYITGDTLGNSRKIIDAIILEKAKGTDLVVFSELCISGYPPRDFLDFKDFIEACNEAVNLIIEATEGIAVLIGTPTHNPKIEGKELYNSALFINDKKLQQTIHKTLLPTYDVFDEYRYFEPATEWNVVEFQGYKIAVTICEDIWNLGDNPLYAICPLDKLMSQNPQLIINLSASPFDYTHAEDRMAMVIANTLKYNLPLLYCNSVGSQTEIIFDGGSLAFTSQGDLVGELAYFKEDEQTFHFDGTQLTNKVIRPKDQLPLQSLNPNKLDFALNIDRIYHALILGIKDYFSKMGFKHAILGASGGIDSAVTQALAVAALGAENVTVLLMPSEYSSSHSVEDAVQLSKNLQNPFHIIEINPIYQSVTQQLKDLFKDKLFDITEENIQARSRGILLMAMANKFGYILLNTSNKSELAVGYGTLYGDMAGGIAVLGDVYKMQVFELAKYINRDQEIIPHHILVKPPSAELRSGQKDSDSLPAYQDLDTILYQYIERVQSPADIAELGFEPTLVDRIIRMVNRSEYKRAQFCPIIRVSPKAFGPGRRIPIVARYLD